MDLQRYLDGPQAQLPQMLAARERRGQMQARLLAEAPMTLICFTLNIAGPVKAFSLARWTFDEGVSRIKHLCAAWGFSICREQQIRAHTGLECCLSVNAPAAKVKGALMALEEEDPLGRLFDLDVLDAQGQKVSRGDFGAPERTCLICGQPVFLCSRSRAHSLETIQTRTCEIMEEAYRAKRGQRAARLAAAALLREVETTPKPGLVDLNNRGAHRDMDVGTFTHSALALVPYFEEFFACPGDRETVLPTLRSIGIRAERAMREATGGVNTHKGMIFSMGILLGALSAFDGWKERPTRAALRDMCKTVAAPLAGDFARLSGETHGEQLYLAHGIRGARGEALGGFPALFETALPILDGQLSRGADWNTAGVATLLSVMAQVEDSNTIARSTPERAAALRREIAEVLSKHPAGEDLAPYAAALDQRLIRENISPGGSADILALAWFVHFLEEEGLIDA